MQGYIYLTLVVMNNYFTFNYTSPQIKFVKMNLIVHLV